MKKQIQFLAVTVLAFGLSACGGNDEVVPVQTVYQAPPNPTQGSFNNFNNQAIQWFQQTYGNITTDAPTTLGSVTLPQGTHAWQTVYDHLEQAAAQCNYCQIGARWGGYSYTTGLSSVDQNRFRDYLGMHNIARTRAVFERDPGYTNYNMAYVVDAILNQFSSAYAYLGNYWGYTGYPGYTPYYPHNGLSIGVSYGSGNGSINFGGSYYR